MPSVGIRPGVVYGVGRDQGLTSKTTVAILAAAAGRPYTVPFSGAVSALHAGEIASAFIKAVSKERDGAPVFDLNGRATSVAEWLDIVRAVAPGAQLEIAGDPCPSRRICRTSRSQVSRRLRAGAARGRDRGDLRRVQAAARRGRAVGRSRRLSLTVPSTERDRDHAPRAPASFWRSARVRSCHPLRDRRARLVQRLGDDVDQRRPAVLERLGERGPQVGGILDPPAP